MMMFRRSLMLVVLGAVCWFGGCKSDNPPANSTDNKTVCTKCNQNPCTCPPAEGSTETKK